MSTIINIRYKTDMVKKTGVDSKFKLLSLELFKIQKSEFRSSQIPYSFLPIFNRKGKRCILDPQLALQ